MKYISSIASGLLFYKGCVHLHRQQQNSKQVKYKIHTSFKLLIGMQIYDDIETRLARKKFKGKNIATQSFNFAVEIHLRKALTIKVAAQRGFGFDYCKEG